MPKPFLTTFLLVVPAFTRLLFSGTPVTYIVFPPENMSNSAALGWVGEGIALSISDQLRMPGVEAIGRDERINFVETADLPPNTALSQASMIHVAQQASADRLVMGSYSGSEEYLRIAIRVLDLKAMKLKGGLSVSGPMTTLTQMENELAWMLLDVAGLTGDCTREKFRERSRSVPNAAYAPFVQALTRSDQEEQVKLLQKAVSICPTFSEAHFFLGRYYHRQGDCTNVIRHLKLAGNLRRSYLEDQFILGNCYIQANDNGSALRAFSTILSFTPSAQVLNNAGVANMRKGDYMLAAQNLVEARNLLSNDPTISMNLALVRHLQGNEEAALGLLKELESKHPNRALVEYVLSVVLRAMGETQKVEDLLASAKKNGLDLDKFQSQDASGWARIFTSWEASP